MNAHPDVIHVLCVEDNLADATLIQELLAQATRLGWDMPRFKITHVSRMRAALDHLETDEQVDAVLTDLDLPDSRSDATFATLREHAPTLPIVVLTSRDDVELARQTVRAGAEDYLFKREMSGSLLAHALIYAIERRKDKLALQRANETLEARVAARTEELQRTNAALRESEQRFRIMFEEAPVGVTQTDVDGHWLRVNQRFCEIVGYPQEALIGMRWQEITHPDDLAADEGGTRRMLEGEISTFSYEKRYIRKDGGVIWVDLTASLVRTPSGEPAYFIAVVQDITARKQAKAALQESEARYRTLTEAAPVGINQTALDGHWIHTNPRFCEITGYTYEELTHLRWQEITHPDDRDLGRRRTRRLLEGEISSFSIEKRYIRKDGTIIWVNISISLVRTPSGAPDYFVSIVQDVNARKRTEQALRESEARERARTEELKTIMDTVPAVIWTAHDPHCHRITGNPAAYRLLQMEEARNTSLTPDEGQRPPQFELHHNGSKIPSEALPMQQACNLGVTTRNYEMEIVLEDGTTRTIFGNTVPLKDEKGQTRGAVAAYVDITARKATEAALKKSKARYETLFAASPLPYLVEDASALKAELNALRRAGITDFQTYFAQHPDEVQRCAALVKIVDANRAAISFYQADEKADLLGSLDRFFCAKSALSSMKNLIAIAEGKQRRRFETINQTLKGEKRQIVLEWAVAPGSETTFSQILVFVVDITARKEMEAALIRERNRLQTLMENFPDTIYFKDTASRFTRINRAQAEALGIDDPSRALGKTDADFFGAAFAKASREDEAQILKTGEPLINKMEKIPLADGSHRWVLATKVPIRDEDEEIVGLAGISRDITERKLMEEALRKSERRFRNLFESAPDAIFVEDIEGNVLDVNPAACRLHKMSREALIGKNAADLVPQKIQAHVAQAFPELRTQDCTQAETYCMTREGETVSVELTTRAIEYDGRPAILLHVRDVTERKAVEAALRKSREELAFQAALLDQIQDNIIATDLEGRITYVNAAVTQTLQRPQETLIGQTVHTLGEDPDAGARQESIVKNTLRDGAWDGIVVNRAKDGTNRIMQTRTWLTRDAETDEPTGMIGVSTDITQRREAEEAFERIFNMATEMISVADIERATFALVNPAFEKTLGYTEAELLERPFLDFVHPDDVAPTLAVLEEKLQAGEDVISFQNRYRCKDGTYRWLSWNSHPIPEKGLTYAIATDVTERREREKALQESEARYRGLFENAPISLWEEDFSAVQAYLETLRERGVEDVERHLKEHPEVINACMQRIRFVNFNAATIDLYRAENKEALLQQLDKVLGTKTHPALRQILLAIARGESRVQAETVNYTVDGQKLNVHIDWRVAPGCEETLEKCFVSVKDITPLKKSQAALRRINAELERSNQELEHFAYVTSHDLQEPLRTVRGFLQLLARYYTDQLDETAQAYIEQAVEGAQRMSEMINALLDLSRVETRGQAFESTDVETVLKQTLDALNQSIEENEAVITYDALPTVTVDAVQLGQLLQNLIANAIKFQDGKESPHVHIWAEQEDDLWRFAVRDNGIGIDPEQSRRLFRVFQRLHTREEYPGVGIGLALCKRIVERHGGRIWLKSKPGEGSTFYFTLPKNPKRLD